MNRSRALAGFLSRDASLIFILWLLSSALFWIPALAGQLPFEGFRGEMIMQWLPYRFFMIECYEAGVFPLWIPYIFGGMPFWGYSHTMSSYPLMIFSLLLSLVPGICLFYLAHTAVACWGTFRFLQRVVSSRFLWFCGTILLVPGGWALLVTNREFYLNVAGWTWLPVMLHLALAVLETGRLRYFAGLTAASLMQFLTGDMEAITFNLLTAPVVLLWLRRALPALQPWRRWPALAAALALALLMAAVMWLPLAEYMPHNIRGRGLNFEFYLEKDAPLYPFHPAWFPLFLVYLSYPFLPAQPLGWYVLFFLFWHLLRRPGSALPLLAAAFAFFLYYTRSFIPLEKILYHLPLFSLFLKRVAILAPAVFLLQLLAVRGMEDFLTAAPEKNNSRPAFLLAAVGTAGALAFLVAALRQKEAVLLAAVSLLAYTALFLAALEARHKGLSSLRARLIIGLAVLGSHYAPVLLTSEWQTPDYFRSPLFTAAARRMEPSSRHLIAALIRERDPILYTQAGVLARRAEVFGWNRVPPLHYMELIRLIDPSSVAFDEEGKLSGWNFVFHHPNGSLLRSPSLPLINLLSLRYLLDENILVKHVSPTYLAWLLPPAETAARFRRQNWRDLSLLPRPLSVVLNVSPSQTLKFRLAAQPCLPGSPLNATALLLADHNLLWHQHLSLTCRPEGEARSVELSIPLQNAAGPGRRITFLITSEQISPGTDLWLEKPRLEDPAQPFQLIWQNQKFDLFENQEAFPPAFVVHEVEFCQNRKQLLDRLAHATSEELRRIAFLTEDPRNRLWVKALSSPLPPTAVLSIQVKELLRPPGRRTFLVKSNHPGLLVILQNRLPGWTASVDSRPVPVLEVDGAFAGIPFEPPEHTIEFTYCSRAFQVGLWSSLVSALALVFFSLYFLSKICFNMKETRIRTSQSRVEAESERSGQNKEAER